MALHLRDLRDENVKFDTSWRVMARSDDEVKAGAVDDTGWNGYAKLMTEELRPATVAAQARFRPHLAAAAALAAGTRNRDFERDHGTFERFAP